MRYGLDVFGNGFLDRAMVVVAGSMNENFSATHTARRKALHRIWRMVQPMVGFQRLAKLPNK